MKWRTIVFWLVFGLFAPLILVQATWTRARALRLPAAAGPNEGTVPGRGEPLRILFAGESPVAGIGVTTMTRSVAASTARALARSSGRSVHWHAAGVNGIRIGQALTGLVPQLPEEPFDAVIVVFGVNDTVGLTSVKVWRRQVGAMAVALQQRTGAPVWFTQVPPMARFTALPQPLRRVVGWRATMLDAALRSHPQRGRDFELVRAEFRPDAGQLAEDGYHPSARGAETWGRQIARALHFRENGSPRRYSDAPMGDPDR